MKVRVSNVRRRFAPWVAFFAAALALGVSLYGAMLQRQQVRAQVWPHLNFYFTNVEVFAVGFENGGVGPARLQSVELFVDELPMRNWSQVLTALLRPGDGGALDTEISHVTSTLRKRVIPSGAKVDGLRVTDKAFIEPLDDSMSRLRFKYCFCSVLEECWMNDSSQPDDLGFVPISDCPVPAVPFEE